MVERDEIALREALALDEQTAAGELDELAAQPVAQRPDFFVGNELGIGHSLPELRRVDFVFPGIGRSGQPETGRVADQRQLGGGGAHGEFAAPEAPHRSLHPTQQMNAVGNVADGDLLDRPVGKQALPHLAADPAVQFADAIGRPRGLQGEHRHAERLLLVVRIDSAQRH